MAAMHITWILRIGPRWMRVHIQPDWAGVSTMKRTRHTPEQILPKLKTAQQLIAQGTTVADAFRALEVPQPTFHR